MESKFIGAWPIAPKLPTKIRVDKKFVQTLIGAGKKLFVGSSSPSTTSRCRPTTSSTFRWSSGFSLFNFSTFQRLFLQLLQKLICWRQLCQVCNFSALSFYYWCPVLTLVPVWVHWDFSALPSLLLLLLLVRCPSSSPSSFSFSFSFCWAAATVIFSSSSSPRSQIWFLICGLHKFCCTGGKFIPQPERRLAQLLHTMYCCHRCETYIQEHCKDFILIWW